MPEILRKSPTQTRAAQTIETILDATAQILERDEAEFTTNRVAELAGFSIGTLYQYFRNKDALVEALADRERMRVEVAIAEALAEAPPGDIEAALRIVIRTVIGAFGGRRRMRRFIIFHMIRRNIGPAALLRLNAIGLSVSAAVAARHRDSLRPLPPEGRFILANAITGAVRAAVIADQPMLETQEFEDELVRLALGFVSRP